MIIFVWEIWGECMYVWLVYYIYYQRKARRNLDTREVETSAFSFFCTGRQTSRQAGRQAGVWSGTADPQGGATLRYTVKCFFFLVRYDLLIRARDVNIKPIGQLGNWMSVFFFFFSFLLGDGWLAENVSADWQQADGYKPYRPAFFTKDNVSCGRAPPIAASWLTNATELRWWPPGMRNIRQTNNM